MEAWLAQIEGLLHSTKEKATVAEEQAATIAAQAVHEYKESKDFENDMATVGADAYIFGFMDCWDVIAQAYPELDLTTFWGLGKKKVK